jgi:hypothetical protein
MSLISNSFIKTAHQSFSNNLSYFLKCDISFHFMIHPFSQLLQLPHSEKLINLNTKKVKARFSPEQDTIIKKLAEIQPPLSWNQIANYIPGKNGKQCRERYNHFLSPHISHNPWTNEEDFLLSQCYCIYGSNWAKIAMLFPGRTNQDVKNRWNGHLKEKKIQTFLNMFNVTELQCRKYLYLDDKFSHIPPLKIN